MTMNERPLRATGSLIERAAAAYDFGGLLRQPAEVPAAIPAQSAPPSLEAAPPMPDPIGPGPVVPVDLHHLRDSGFIIPGAPPTALSEEFRLVKRQILLAAFGGNAAPAVDRGRLVLICSAQPNEGKTFCAVNLALSMASETDLEVVLVDADVAKPEILSSLGIAGSAGLMDALADPSLDVERLIVRTDIPNLSVLPAGKQSNTDTELLASARTEALVEGLAARGPRRIILFDSAPALAASPASVLALHVGQALMVVRADQTTESELRDALTLIDACPHIQLLLNAVTFSGSNRKFGSYYGFGD
jgi:protein-tyrosine kinase